MIEFLKLIFSKDFVSNSKAIISIIRKSKSWKSDITRFTGAFYLKDRDESTVLIDQSLKVIAEKNWDKKEISEVGFVLKELFDNYLVLCQFNKGLVEYNINFPFSFNL